MTEKNLNKLWQNIYLLLHAQIKSSESITDMLTNNMGEHFITELNFMYLKLV